MFFSFPNTTPTPLTNDERAAKAETQFLRALNAEPTRPEYPIDLDAIAKVLGLGTAGVALFCVGLAFGLGWCLYYLWCIIKGIALVYWPLIITVGCWICSIVLQIILRSIDRAYGNRTSRSTRKPWSSRLSRRFRGIKARRCKGDTVGQMDSPAADTAISGDTYICGDPPYGSTIDSCLDAACTHDWRLITVFPLSIVAGTAAGATQSDYHITYLREFTCDLCGSTMHDFKDVSC